MQIAAYLGKSERFDVAIADFAKEYADQTERDHAALRAAVKSGRVATDADALKASDVGGSLRVPKNHQTEEV